MFTLATVKLDDEFIKRLRILHCLWTSTLLALLSKPVINHGVYQWTNCKPWSTVINYQHPTSSHYCWLFTMITTIIVGYCCLFTVDPALVAGLWYKCWNFDGSHHEPMVTNHEPSPWRAAPSQLHQLPTAVFLRHGFFRETHRFFGSQKCPKGSPGVNQLLFVFFFSGIIWWFYWG